MGVGLIGVMGCSGAEVVRPPSADSGAALTEVLTAVNSPCPGMHRASSSLAPVRDQLFVEAVMLDVSSDLAKEITLSTLKDLPQTARVQLVAAPHLIADFDHQAEMALGASGATSEQISLVRWSLLARHADRGEVLDVELDLALPTSKSGVRPVQKLTFAASARDNEPSLARIERDAASQRSLLLLLRTFEVHGEEDLRAIFECKMQQHAQALGRVRADGPQLTHGSTQQ
jgi:hypothetical protein